MFLECFVNACWPLSFRVMFLIPKALLFLLGMVVVVDTPLIAYATLRL